ncbi:hypothetical protein T459_23711 [Capsicum annuum]|uniref:Ubiquitin-like protease family profile domain-containing protein n=1 Tax=Capsicum annuum TaxID=4072 RepID=A0A2G2YT49_CAPAN|nr:hypothetical protein T459_23711 [Capsicum annuum]
MHSVEMANKQPKKRGRPKKPPLAPSPSVVCHARVSYNDTPIEVVATNKRSEEETRVDVVSRINEGPSFELLSQNMLIASDEVDVKSNKKSTSQFKFFKKEAEIPRQEPLNGNFFQELANSTSNLSDEHIDACLYYFRKKYCYHGEHLSEKINCTTIDTIFNGTVEIVKLFKKHGWFVENSSEEQMTNYARGLQISALTSLSYVDKILLPMRLSPTKNESESTHYVLGVLDLSKKVIDLYDSISDKKYGRRSMALAKTYRRLLPELLKALCLKDEHPSYADDVKAFSVVRKEDVPKQPGAVECGVYMLKFISLIMEDGSIDNFKADEINEWRIELAANLWQHCMWKKETGYATPEENGYDDYGDNEVNMCPFDL